MNVKHPAHKPKASIMRAMAQGTSRKYFAASIVATGTEINPETAINPTNPALFFNLTKRLLLGVKTFLPRSSLGPLIPSHHEKSHFPKFQNNATPPAAPRVETLHTSYHGTPAATMAVGVTKNFTTAAIIQPMISSHPISVML
jgi:hypothetical protein